jgi:hypothetical protein
MLYAVIEKMCRSRPAWFVSRGQIVAQLDHQKYRASRVDEIYTATWRADRGAMGCAHVSDSALMQSMTRFSKCDILPSETIKRLFPADFE